MLHTRPNPGCIVLRSPQGIRDVRVVELDLHGPQWRQELLKHVHVLHDAAAMPRLQSYLWLYTLMEGAGMPARGARGRPVQAQPRRIASVTVTPA